jgi:hypothetical protein
MTEAMAQHRPVLADRITELCGETLAFEFGDHVRGFVVTLAGHDPCTGSCKLAELKVTLPSAVKRLLPTCAGSRSA